MIPSPLMGEVQGGGGQVRKARYFCPALCLFKACIQLVSATLGLKDFRRGFESETFSRTFIEPGFDVC